MLAAVTVTARQQCARATRRAAAPCMQVSFPPPSGSGAATDDEAGIRHPQLEDLVCEVCGDGGDEEVLIMCDGACGCGYHTYCLTPEIEEVPDGDWFCTSCAKRPEGVSSGEKRAPAAVRSKRPVTASNMSTDEDGLVLDPAQERVLHLCRERRNVFFSGMGGTGKSFLIRRIVKTMEREFNAKVAVTAPTGVAALLIGGQTLHSFAGCNVPSTVADLDRCWNADKAACWRALDMLIIDEVSMIQASFLDWLDCTVRAIRGNDTRPFGGIQLVVAGDFHQLHGFVKEGGASLSCQPPSTPPCQRACQTAGGCIGAQCQENKANRRIPVNIKELQGLAFQSVCWREAGFVSCELTRCFRQEDAEMVQALSRIRSGELDSCTLSFLRRCERDLPEDDGILSTVLYATNRNVDAQNLSKMAELPGPSFSFYAEDSVHVDLEVPARRRPQAEAALWRDPFFSRQCVVPETVRLKLHAQVMLLKNRSQDLHLDAIHRLVNGSRGVVVGFIPEHEAAGYDAVQHSACSLSPIGPGELGLEGRGEGGLDNVEAQLSRLTLCDAAQHGVGGGLEGGASGRQRMLPIVKFQGGRKEVIVPEVFEQSVFAVGVCRRVQLPLKLAWALTIHKAQGQSLDKVSVDLSGCFAQGQAYVALSRARSANGLKVTHFRRSAIKTNTLAKAFHWNLSRGDSQVTEFVNACALWWQPLENPHLIRQDGTREGCVGVDAFGKGEKVKAREAIPNGIRAQELIGSRSPPSPPLRPLQGARKTVRSGASGDKETQEEVAEGEEEEERGERASGMMMWWRELFRGNRHYRRWTCCYSRLQHLPEGHMQGNGAGEDGEEAKGEHVQSGVHVPAALRSKGGRADDVCTRGGEDGKETSFEVLDEEVSDEEARIIEEAMRIAGAC